MVAAGIAVVMARREKEEMRVCERVPLIAGAGSMGLVGSNGKGDVRCKACDHCGVHRGTGPRQMEACDVMLRDGSRSL